FLRRHGAEAAAPSPAAHVGVPLAREWVGAACAFGLFVGAPVGAELVVLLALGRIAEDLVGLVDLFEFRFGRFVTRVDVRVMLARELPEGLLDLLLGGALRHAERGVIVFEVHGYRPTISFSRRISESS